MRRLAKVAATLAHPSMERRSVWHTLAGGDHWVLILIRHARKGSPPERRPSGVRINPAFLRRTGAGLKPDLLIYERINQYLRAYAQESLTIGVAAASNEATDAVLDALAELGVTLPE